MTTKSVVRKQPDVKPARFARPGQDDRAPDRLGQPVQLDVRKQVFISYSHKDKVWLKKLQEGLKPYLRREIELKVWDDTTIKPGADWREEIKKSLAAAKAAVLLVSPDFLASDFIVKDELPPLLKAAEKEGLTILWVAVRHSAYQVTEIERYQAVNVPSRPLASLKRSDQDKDLTEICKRIVEAATHKEKD